MTSRCMVFRWIGQSLRSCDACGRPTWEHIADAHVPAGSPPFGKSITAKLRPRSRIDHDRAITEGLASGALQIRMTPNDTRYEAVIEATS